MKRIGIVVKAQDKAIEKAEKLASWLQDRGVESLTRQNIPAPITSDHCLIKNVDRAPSDLACIVVLGGDGTFISAIRWVQDTMIPVLGVNLGAFGFLTEVSADRLFPIMDRVIRGDYLTEERILLSAEVLREGKAVACQTVLNDVVINKEALARIAHIHVYVDDDYLTTFKSDGLIVATPTGSTAYSLSAGGPIVHPCVKTIILTPICPFTLINRPLMLPDGVTIRIMVEQRDSNIFLTFDGQVGLHITHEDAVIVKKAPHAVRMIKSPDQNYYELLKSKLSWSGR